MIGIRSNINIVADNILAKIEKLKNPEYLLRPVCFDIVALMTERIHQKGEASDGSQIGTYSEGYMKLRTGNYGNADKFKKGANKGKNKNAGTFTDRTIRLNKQTGTFSGEDKVGKARPNYNRSSDTKIIVSLTRQLENDWSVVAIPKGYGIGFLNAFNLQKAGWVEEVKDKVIFKLSESEKDYATTKLLELIRDAIHS